MLASYVVEFGSPDGLRFGPVEAPSPGPGQVLVRMQAASLDRVDTYIRRGTHGMATAGPTVLGRDIAGVVVGLGPGMSGFEPGQRAVGLGLGTHAELAVGTFAVQHARHLRARVFGTAGGYKCATVQWTGAAAAVDHYADDVVTALWVVLPGGEVDVIIESVGAKVWSDVLKALAPGGWLVTYGATAASHAHLHLGRLMVKGWTLRGIGSRGRRAAA